MASSPSVIVLLAAYNGSKWIDTLLDSIFNQLGIDVTIYVSVDLSDDKTFDLLHNRQNNESRLFLLPYGERFGSAGKNFFRLIKDVNVDSFDYVAFADQDDIWLEDKLIRAHQMISSNDVDCYSSDVVAFWPDKRNKILKKSYPQKLYDHFFESAGPGCTYVIKASVFTKIKSFVCSNYNECLNLSLHDWFVYAYSRQSKFKWFIDDKPNLLYRQHDSNVFGANNGILAFNKRLQYIKSNWYKDEVHKIINLTDSNSSINLTDRFFLIKNFSQLRRRFRDCLLLLILVILGLF